MLDLLGNSKSLEIIDFFVPMKNMCVADSAQPQKHLGECLNGNVMVGKGESWQKGQEEPTFLLTNIAPWSELIVALIILLGQSGQPKPAQPVPPLNRSGRCWRFCVSDCVWLEAAKNRKHHECGYKSE